MALPLPMMHKGITTLRQDTLERDIERMFREHLGVDVSRRVGVKMVLMAGPKDSAYSYSKAEVAEWMWCVVASYVDAKVISLLPRQGSLRATRHGKSQLYVAAHGGNAWPRNDDEWQRGADVLVSLLDMPESCPDQILWGLSGTNLDKQLSPLRPTSIDDVVDYIWEAISTATGVNVDKILLHEHLGPVCLHLEPSIFLAKTLTRSFLLGEIVGETLSMLVRRRQYESDWKVMLRVDESGVLSCVGQELADLHKRMAHIKSNVADGSFNQVRDTCGRSFILTRPNHSSSWGGDKLKESRLKKHEDICGLVGTNATCAANVKLSKYYREIAVSGAHEQALDLLKSSGNQRRLSEYLLHYDEALEHLIADKLNKAIVYTI